MTQQNNTPVETAGAADTPHNETALADVDEALDRELGISPDADDITPPDEEAAEAEQSEQAAGAEEEAEDEPAAEEAEEEAEDDSPDEDEDDDPSASDDADFKSIPEEHQKTVGKLIAKARSKALAKNEAKLAELSATAEQVPELEAARDSLEDELSELRAAKTVPAPTAERPLAALTSTEDLRTYVQNARTHLRELRSNPDEVQVPDGQGGQRYLTEAEVQSRIASLQDRLEFDVPEHRDFLRDRAKADQKLEADFPELAQAKSPLTREVNKVLAAQPQLKLMPDARRKALTLALGEKLLAQHGAKAYAVATGKAAPAAKAAKTPAQKAAAKAAPRAPAPPASSSAPRRAAAPATPGKFSEEALDEELFG